MSRVCVYCEMPVTAVGPVTKPTVEFVERYLGNNPRDYHFAPAHCPACEARYMAWFVFDAEDDEFYIADLSWRSTFNDEPAPEDLPRYRVARTLVYQRSKLEPPASSESRLPESPPLMTVIARLFEETRPFKLDTKPGEPACVAVPLSFEELRDFARNRHSAAGRMAREILWMRIARGDGRLPQE